MARSRRLLPGRWLVQGRASRCRWEPEHALQAADQLRAAGLGVFWARRDGELDYGLMHFAAVVAAETSDLARAEVHAVLAELFTETPDVCQVVITTVVELTPTMR